MTTSSCREFSSLVDLLQFSVATFGDRPLFGALRGDEIDWTSFSQFSELVAGVRGGLSKLGVGPGDRVGVIANNRLEWAVGAHACFGLGAAYVPMYEAQHESEWQYILGDSGAVLCLCATDDIARRVAGLRGELPALKHVVSFEGDSGEASSYQALLASGRQQPVVARDVAPSEVATVIYTSGTTGAPKGVVLTHKNLASAVNSLVANVDVGTDDCGVAFLPWAHVFGGCVEMNLGLATGTPTVICGEATRLIEYLPIAKPTVLFAVPRVWNRIHAGVHAKMAAAPEPVQQLFKAAMAAKVKELRGEALGAQEQKVVETAEQSLLPGIRQILGGRLRFAVSGAAALAREVGEFICALGIEVHEGYGLTETCGAATAQPKGAARLGSVGVALPGVRLELDKTAPSATSDDEGELIIYGDNVMRGYHGLQKETATSLTSDGGLKTGDLARIDADGYVYITGRAKELYKLENGKYVVPTPIEQRVELSPFIHQCVVVGANKPHNVALIIPEMAVLAPWAAAQGLKGSAAEIAADPRVTALLEQEVQDQTRDLKGYERIQDFVVDLEPLSIDNGMLTHSMKLKRAAIMQKYGAVFEALYPRHEAERRAPRASYINELRGTVKTA